MPAANGSPPNTSPEKAEKQFEADEADDVPFQAQAALVVHEFDEGAGGLADERELSLHRTAALHQLVFILQSPIKTLELGMIPKNIGFFLDLYASDHPVLGQQHVADLPQQLSGLRARPAFALQSHCERLDAVEDAGDARLRMPEDQALRQYIGDDLEALDGGICQRDDARGFDLIFSGRIDPHLYLVGFRDFERIVDPCPQRAQDLVFLNGR
jgi:hypothetical protein